jgi:hypothetical protein
LGAGLFLRTLQLGESGSELGDLRLERRADALRGGEVGAEGYEETIGSGLGVGRRKRGGGSGCCGCCCCCAVGESRWRGRR